ncbi:MAG TPA: nicotinate (nicotinamide) nucleotide adenylyltransferase [Actinobacteria bacterium]|nr:nicotinate (nicotinamide) nucleotide adenylyltransferase [Actinomycetota bacterium]
MRGILGGTFDPPHIAHLVAAEAAYRQLGLDRVTFLPAGAPWQKSGRRVSAPEHRWAMTRRAVAGVEYFDADDREVRRPGWTYTIDTLEELAERVVLVLGADAARGLPTWHRAEDVLARVEVAVVPRPGVAREEVDAVLGARASWLDVPPLEVSGTRLRSMVAAGRSVRFLVPDPVWRYIDDHGLYREGR